MTNNDRWRKSSYSGGQSNDCVELDVAAGHTGIRDTKNRAKGTLSVSATSWFSFMEAIKDGELDR